MVSRLLRAIVRTVLPIIHKGYTIALGVKPLGRGNSLICVELRRHKGRAVKLLDGCEVRPGDHIIKLHLNNDWFTEKRQSSLGLRMTVLPLELTRYFKDGFRLLAAQVADGKYGNIVAVYAWTVLYAPARRMGFYVTDLPNTLRTKLAQLYITALMRIYHIRGYRKCKAVRKPLKVKAVWLSRAELLRIYH